MRVIGLIVTGIAALFVFFGVVLGVRSLPDIKRYLRMKSM